MLKNIPGELWTEFIDVFRGRNAYWHVLAIALTYVLVVFGVDWQYYLATRSESLRILIFVAGLGGFLVPVLVPAALILYGRAWGSARERLAGIAGAHAVAVAWTVSALYKTFTGRIQPEFLTHIGSVDISRDFNFGILRNGIFWGWPSSHASVALALSVVIFLIYRRFLPRTVALIWAAIVCAGASIGFHWLSDVAAGAIIGTVVATVVVHRARSRTQ